MKTVWRIAPVAYLIVFDLQETSIYIHGESGFLSRVRGCEEKMSSEIVN